MDKGENNNKNKNKSKNENDEVINPLDFLDLYLKEEADASAEAKNILTKSLPASHCTRGVFITGTDTNVGKTVVTHVLGTLIKGRGMDVGFMKPVQCGGNDTKFLMKALGLKDSLKEVNPYFAREPLSPNLAFKRKKQRINTERILEAYHTLAQRHEFMLVEGAGGLLVPIKDNYLVADLIKDLDLELIIVSRLGLGAINHTLLTVSKARDLGIKVKGVIFTEITKEKKGIPEETNPQIISRLARVPVLGIIPYLDNMTSQGILDKCRTHVDLKAVLKKEIVSKTSQLKAWDKKYIWHPFTQMQDWLKEEPLVVDEAKGCYLKDTDGNKYLDGVSSLWVNVHGHQKKEIDLAVKKQVSQLSHSTLLGISNTPAVELAKKLVEITPRGLDKVFYSDNGSTSVEIAIKMAYQYWQNTGKTQKTNIVHLANSYHGDTLGSVSVGGIDLFQKVYRRLVFRTIQISFPDCYRAPHGKTYPDYAFECLDKMEAFFKSSHQTLAALVVEPVVQAAAGMIVWPDGILKRMENICRKYNVLLIADEVATGFGRTGSMFVCDSEKVHPDFLCLAKGLTGGYLPLAATLTTKKIFNGFLFDYKDQKTFFHGHTYTGNPLCCAAALASLHIFAKEQTLKHLQPKIKYFSSELKKFYQLKHVGHIRQKGFMVGIELVRDKKTKSPYSWSEKIGVKVCQTARKRGVILRPLGNVIVLMPPLSMTEKELEYLLSVTFWAMKKVTE